LAYEFGRYLKIRGAWGASWSPDGRRVAFLTDITGVPQVWEVAAGGGWPEQLTFHDERVSSAEYSPTEDRLLFGMDTGGNERSQLFLLGDGQERDLTRAPDAIHYSGGFSPNGGRVAITATRRNGTDFDVFVQGPAEKEPETVWEVPGYHTVSGWSPDGSSLIVSRHHSNVDNDLYWLDLRGGEATLLTPHEGEARFRSASVAPEGDYLYLATDRDGDFVRLARMDLSTLELEYLTGDDHDVEEVELSRDGRLLAVTRNVWGYSGLLLFNVRGGRMPDPDVKRGVVGGLAFSQDSKRLAFTLGRSSCATRPSTAGRYPPSSTSRRRRTRPSSLTSTAARRASRGPRSPRCRSTSWGAATRSSRRTCAARRATARPSRTSTTWDSGWIPSRTSPTPRTGCGRGGTRR
jgi:Tol biopolymer transport system component